jgi:hypothetical protein
MPNGPVRRAQLIAPFGTGAMVVTRNGTSLITCGLDHWYAFDDGRGDADVSEFQLEEWRLQQELDVDHFRQPPDYRKKWQYGDGDAANTGLTIPFLRFPMWHFCQRCGHLDQRGLTERTRPKCTECETKGKYGPMFQVPFVAMCDAGHIQDFPWCEWVHKSARPDCKGPLRLKSTGAASLAGQSVTCDGCGKRRDLSLIMGAKTDGSETELSNNLDPGGPPFLCAGKRPWLGTDEASSCGHPLRGSLRNASNLYFAQVRSAIYLPRGNSIAPSALVARFEEPPLSTLVKVWLSSGETIQPADLRVQQPQVLQPYSDAEIMAAIAIIQLGGQAGAPAGEDVTDEDAHSAFRRAEFNVLRAPRDEEHLLIRQQDTGDYEPDIARYFSRMMLVNKLKETRALAGFTRAYPENDQSLEDRKELLWRDVPYGRKNWLPAYAVFGEGLFLEFNEALLQAWEKRSDVSSRVQPLKQRYEQLQQNRRLRDRPLTPRFVLLHTFAHIVMNRLSFECGYSSAALRERLYVSENPAVPMAGVLIYTAAGDAEGTMGGLVRMGKPSYFEPVIRRALEGAQWCSTDPVCMEIGAYGGQGPDSCNLAACHNCALVPETACEEFNRFLDRGVITGTPENNHIGFFAAVS